MFKTAFVTFLLSTSVAIAGDYTEIAKCACSSIAQDKDKHADCIVKYFDDTCGTLSAIGNKSEATTCYAEAVVYLSSRKAELEAKRDAHLQKARDIADERVRFNERVNKMLEDLDKKVNRQ